MNRVWIELERPDFAEVDAVGQKRAELANKMMRKLGADYDMFFWWPDKKKYSRVVCKESGGFVWLTDGGDWFDLEKLAE